MGILIKGGLIVSGNREKPFIGDIYIEGEKIKKIGTIESKSDMKVIDAKGLVVSPGFVDTHSHSDLKVLTEPELLPKIKQGITTEVLGQDGISMAPLPPKYISNWRKNIAGLDGDTDEIDWKYENTENYLKMIGKSNPAINEAYLLPHGNVRMEIIGLDNRKPTKEELAQMCKVVEREMNAGCYGLSSGLIYTPCTYSETDELIELCKVVHEYNGVFVVHQRSEGDSIISSMKEVIEIGRKSGVKIHFSHFKICGKNNWEKADEILKLLDKAREEGIEVSFDQYPYIAGSTMLGVILPPWVHNGGTNKLLERLESKEERKKIINDIENGIDGWDNFIDFAGFDGIFVTSVKSKKNEKFVGLSLKDIADKTNKNPYDATFDLLLEEENAVGMVDFYGKEELVQKFMQREEMNVCTDGLLGGKPHPRAYGAFPRVIGKYVRENESLTLEEAVYKMTKKACMAIGIKERGEIKEEYYADITIFDFMNIKDKGTFVNPIQYPEGIKYVIVNGNIAIDNENQCKNRTGKVLFKEGK